MSRKKNTSTSANTNPQALKLGTRVRCTDDGVLGKIVWANAVSVKVRWDDGEQVTWKRDSLAGRPIAILDADSEDQPAAPTATDAAEGNATPTEAEQPAAPADAAEPTTTTEQLQAEPEATPTIVEQPQAAPEVTPTTAEQPQAEPETMPTTADPNATELVATPTEQPTTETAPVSDSTVGPATPTTDGVDAPTDAKPKRQRKAAEPKEKKVSALDAAARVLAEEGRPMTCKELIAAMAAKGYWTSPGGQTPDATLYSAILREVSTKGTNSRFQKTERGKFARPPAA
jgi:hypothetical protein